MFAYKWAGDMYKQQINWKELIVFKAFCTYALSEHVHLPQNRDVLHRSY